MTEKLKKLTAVLLLILVFAVFATVAAGCSATDFSNFNLPENDEYETKDWLSDECMKNELSAFLGACKDRTSLSESESPDDGDGEYAAAEYIASRLETLTGTKGDIRSFTQQCYDDEFKSANVVFEVAAKEGNNPDDNKVIIGTHYDNTYSSSPMGGKYSGYNYFAGTKAEGAMSDGTSVAVMLRLCEYFAGKTDELTVDIDFVFYGMGCYDYYGARDYYRSLGETGRSNIRLAVTLDNIGGDNLYLYFDEKPTPHGKFIMGIAKTVGYDNYVSEPPATQVDLPVKTVDSLPYTPFELLNESSVYFDSENICTVTSGSDNTFLLYRQDGYGKESIRGTSSDTLAELEKLYPDYSNQMSVAADLLVRSVMSEGFAEACGDGRSVSYGFWTSSLAAYIAGAVLGAALFAVTIIVVKKLRKKYAEPEMKRNIKIAVFGMDYEQPHDGDIFFDIHSPRDDDPFSDAFDGGNEKYDDDHKDDK